MRITWREVISSILYDSDAGANGILIGIGSTGEWEYAHGGIGGVGIFTAVIVAVYVTELTRFLKLRNIGIRLPEQVPANIKQSFDLLIPILAVIITLYPLSLLIQEILISCYRRPLWRCSSR